VNIFFYREHRVQKSPIGRLTPSNLRVSASPLSSVESVIIRDIRVPILEPICGICVTILKSICKKNGGAVVVRVYIKKCLERYTG
jgi:hypothetical protein